MDQEFQEGRFAERATDPPLNLVRHLLDHVPYRQLADPPVKLTPLPHKPKRERFTWRLKPIRGWY